jgi:methionyl-tRNA formyltransferase
VSNGRRGPGVVLFGMRYVGSPPALKAMLAASFDVRAVVMPGPPGMTALPLHAGGGARRGDYIPLALPSEGGEDHVGDIARAAGIPVLITGNLRRQDVVDTIAAFQPDVIAVSCFPWRVPPAILELPRFGCLNVHPSLLPRHRGLDPVFWTLRRGDRESGVTIHLMDKGYDSGPIVLQERVLVPVGVRLPDFERQLSEVGGALLVRAVTGLVSGQIVPEPQDDRLATMAPAPTEADYVVPTDLSAEWAYNFVRGVAPLGGPLTLHVVSTSEFIRLRDAVSYTPDGLQMNPIERVGEQISVQFRPGLTRFWPAAE